MKHCNYIKSDGTKCKAFAVKDDNFCFSHSEKYSEQHKQAVLNGGKSLKRSYTDKEPVYLRNNEDAVYLIEQVINEVRANKLSMKAGSVLAILINLALKTIPRALSDKGAARGVDLFNRGELDMKHHIEKLEGEVRNKK